MNLVEFDKRQNRLEYARVELKNRFFGIDHIVDDVIARISSWYIFPDLNTRPAIICLWGMTGVGKTDLVRNLVSLLGIGDQFHEIQLSGSSKTYETTIAAALRYSKLRPNTQGVLLLDEVQRFRTVSEGGSEKNEYSFSDLWMLLSDGKLQSSTSFEDVVELLFDIETKEKERLAEKAAPPVKSKKKSKNPIKVVGETTVTDATAPEESLISRWRAKSLKHDLNLTESVDEIMKWTSGDLRAKMYEFASQDILVRNYDNYSKLLIVISGNLDEAFTDAFDVEDADIDADMLHVLTKSINMLHIKSALLERFKPEQIARFGNNHILYPTLPRMAFENIIERTLKTYLEFLFEKTGIRVVQKDRSVLTMLYNNGVFPSQGTRPVFSTVSDFTNVVFPTIILRALRTQVDTIKIWCDDTTINTSNGDSIFYNAPLDEIRKSTSIDKNLQTIVAVHEAGHALVQMHIFSQAPFQLKLHNDGTGGSWVCSPGDTFSSVLGAVQVYYAGTAAETIVFGAGDVSTGASQDIAIATGSIARIIRSCGFATVKTMVIGRSHPDAHLYDINIDQTNAELRKVANSLYSNTHKFLKGHEDQIKTLAKMLMSKRILTSVELAEFGKAMLDKEIKITTSEQVNEKMYVRDYFAILEDK